MNPKFVKKAKPPASPFKPLDNVKAKVVNSPKQDFDELQFNVNDDYKTLVRKNTKLRSLLVKASDKINELVSSGIK
jgi:hypothetical protein